jgi:hypothetical protein
MESDTVEPRQRLGVRMIADDHRNGATQLTALTALKNIGQAVQVLGYEQRYPERFRHRLQAPAHPEFRGYATEFILECVQVETIQRPFHAHEKQPRLMVLMLIGMGDIGPVTVQQARNGRDKAFLVRTIDQQNGRGSHRLQNRIVSGARN